VKRVSIALAVLALLATSCFGGGPETRTVLVDHEHDVFASYYTSYFPNRIEALPGDTVVFRQTWTGEPHSVTMGKIVDKYGRLLKPYLKIFAKKGYEGLPEQTPKEFASIEKKLAWMTDDNDNVQQNGAQPCFLSKALPPKDKNKACTKAEQRQPAFNGRYNWYNSGFIPYQGTGSNTFSVKIAESAETGEHFFFCNYHGPFMSGFLEIKPAGSKIGSQGDASRLAQQQINAISTPLLREFRRARAGRYAIPKEAVPDLKRLGLTRTSDGKTFVKSWTAGLGADHVDNGLIDEFIPKTVKAKVGQKLTWMVIGDHTISFNVPTYFPIIRVAKNGNVTINPKIRPPAGGSPDISKLGQTSQQGPPVVDAGRWNGKGFRSSGLIDAFQNPVIYSMRITKPGTYRFACLVHPPMVGRITVTR
jgi:plastocyanin